MNEEELRRLLYHIMTGGGQRTPYARFLSPELYNQLEPGPFENLARTSPEFQQATLQDTVRTARGDVGVVDTTQNAPARTFDFLGAMKRAMGRVPTALGGIPGAFQNVFGNLQGAAGNLNSLALEGANKVLGTQLGGQAPATGTPSTTPPTVAEAAGSGGTQYATTVGGVPGAPLAQGLPAVPTQLASPAGQAPTVAASPAPQFLGVLAQALQTPAVQQALAAMGQGIAGAGNPINVIGDAAIQQAQGQILQNMLANSTNTGLGATSTAGASPALTQQVLDQRNTERGLEQRDRALDIQERGVELDEAELLTKLTQPNADGVEGWQWNAIKQQVANEWYQQARSNLLARRPELEPLVDIESILGSSASGINADAVFTELSPEQRQQALQQAQSLTSIVERGGPFASVIGAGGQQTQQQAPAQGTQEAPTMTIEQVQQAPVGTVFTAPDGTVYRKISDSELEEL